MLMMTPQDAVDELTYRSYCYNRSYSPHVTVDRWARVYGPTVWAMEARRVAQQA